ncbi:sulfotransferase domain-containing protein [Sedimentitalea nanhaiensis]|uniref:Sulfotransferase domain-containing protein n=2 Tax=Sedimentitalea nanhaiensis TaxID=999627 RepID=A0A1I7E1Q5_9RHOB|nr:sulfotransferase domain-containing protein [Sedimentitalea nanhaiensis]SFU17871.1 Sulfotransferase domain-containing protein [Sedimentitalea nanhaiensis]
MTAAKSLLALSMHKAGSSITNKILTDFCCEKGIEIDDISQGVLASPLPEREVFLRAQSGMHRGGAYFGMARGPYVRDMKIIPALRIVVQLRDPRDCITSAYFSYTKSHRPPADPEKLKEFMARRDELKMMSIDEFACDRAQNYVNRMTILADILADHPEALVLKYEEMVTDTPAWLNRIAAFLDQPVTDSLRDRLGHKIDFSVAREDVSKHKRQVAPGDHARKLTPQTIAVLNAKLAAPMGRLGYGI